MSASRESAAEQAALTPATFDSSVISAPPYRGIFWAARWTIASQRSKAARRSRRRVQSRCSNRNPGWSRHAREVGHRAHGEVVDADDLDVLAEQALAQVGADEPGGAGDSNALHVCYLRIQTSRTSGPGPEPLSVCTCVKLRRIQPVELAPEGVAEGRVAYLHEGAVGRDRQPDAVALELRDGGLLVRGSGVRAGLQHDRGDRVWPIAEHVEARQERRGQDRLAGPRVGRDGVDGPLEGGGVRRRRRDRAAGPVHRARLAVGVGQRELRAGDDEEEQPRGADQDGRATTGELHEVQARQQHRDERRVVHDRLRVLRVQEEAVVLRDREHREHDRARERQLRVGAPRARGTALPQHDPHGTGRRAEGHPAVDELQAVAQRLGVRDGDPGERQDAEHQQGEARHAPAPAAGDELRDDQHGRHAGRVEREPRAELGDARRRSAACAPARSRRRRCSSCRPGRGSRTAGRRRRWRGRAGRRPRAGSPTAGAATSAASRHGAALACRRTTSHAPTATTAASTYSGFVSVLRPTAAPTASSQPRPAGATAACATASSSPSSAACRASPRWCAAGRTRSWPG